MRDGRNYVYGMSHRSHEEEEHYSNKQYLNEDDYYLWERTEKYSEKQKQYEKEKEKLEAEITFWKIAGYPILIMLFFLLLFASIAILL